MFPDSVLDQALIQAYLETHYVVSGDPSLVLKVGTANDRLATLHARHACSSSAFITACNPFSRELDAAANQLRQDARAHVLRAQGITYLEGTGQQPSNGWVGEASYLVLGVTLERAKAIGEQFEQNAIVWCGSDAVPQLILLR